MEEDENYLQESFPSISKRGLHFHWLSFAGTLTHKERFLQEIQAGGARDSEGSQWRSARNTASTYPLPNGTDTNVGSKKHFVQGHS